MDKFLIKGPCKIKGQVTISGSKNAALPILAATLLFDKAVTIENLPRVQDYQSKQINNTLVVGGTNDKLVKMIPQILRRIKWKIRPRKLPPCPNWNPCPKNLFSW